LRQGNKQPLLKKYLYETPICINCFGDISHKNDLVILEILNELLVMSFPEKKMIYVLSFFDPFPKNN
jgi:hypothetical protein